MRDYCAIRALNCYSGFINIALYHSSFLVSEVLAKDLDDRLNSEIEHDVVWVHDCVELESMGFVDSSVSRDVLPLGEIVIAEGGVVVCVLVV